MARLTRREIAALLGVAPLAAQSIHLIGKQVVDAQTAAPPSQPAVDAPASALQKAHHDVAEAGEKLRAIAVPMDVSPAFVFKA